MSFGVGVGGGSVGRPAPTQKIRRAASGGGSVGRPYPGRGIGLGRRVGSVGRMFKMLLRITITPQTTSDTN
eukprot:6769507-Prymnesium_polylepis.1